MSSERMFLKTTTFYIVNMELQILFCLIYVEVMGEVSLLPPIFFYCYCARHEVSYQEAGPH